MLSSLSLTVQAATTTIYCRMTQSWWTSDGAAVGIYAWNDKGSNAAYPGERMTPVEGEEGLWSFDLDLDVYRNCTFIRVTGSGAVSDWGAKTVELTIPTDGKNLFTITNEAAVWGDPGCTGEWGTYAAWNNPYASLVNTRTVVHFNDYNWYIIADNSTAADAGTVTLLAADNSFGLSAFDANNNNTYSSSTVKGYLDQIVAGTAGEGKPDFSNVTDAIQCTDLTDVGVNGANLYLLSSSEVGQYIDLKFTGATNDGWWSRSPSSNEDGADCVLGEYSWICENTAVVNPYGVRPALKLDLSKVSFDSESNTFSVAGAQEAVTYVYYTTSGTTATMHTDGSQTSYTVVTDQTEWNDGGWYVVNSDVTIADRITVSGTVNLILCDGKTLTASKGITVNSENTLNIYAQSEDEGSGALTATGAEFEGDNAYAGIGGTKYNAGGTVIIHGGNVTAKGGKFGAGGAAGIGGGFQGAGGSVTIYAGTVDATGNSTGAGIGGGPDGAGGSVAIYGGTVTATGGEFGGAGIGGGSQGAGGSVAIHGGTVTATGGSYGQFFIGMGIGKGSEGGSDGTLTLGTGVTMEVSSDNSTWTDYDGSTRAQYMKTAVTVIEFLLTLDAVSNGTLAIVGEELPEGVTATATEGQYKVVSGTSVTIKATPAEGYHLVSWSNSADMNEDDTQTITLTDDLTLSVTFAADVVTPVGSVTIQDTEADEWYDLTGRRLNGKPATRGLYIHNNTKTIVK